MSYLLLLQQNPIVPEQPPHWFDSQTLFTAAGSTTAVIAVTSILQRIYPRLPARWVALVLSLALAIMGIGVGHEAWTALNVFIAAINGLMTYSAAVGVNTVATTSTGKEGSRLEADGRTYRWWN